jgi:hypothetical protein
MNIVNILIPLVSMEILLNWLSSLTLSPHSWLAIGLVAKVTQRVILLTLHDQLSLPRFLWGSCFSILGFLCTSLLVLFRLVIVLHGLRITDSDYPFGIQTFLMEFIYETFSLTIFIACSLYHENIGMVYICLYTPYIYLFS